jgi:hypothetical protein
MQATTLMMVKNELIINLINEYYEIGSNNYHFIDDDKQTIQISKKYTLSRYI